MNPYSRSPGASSRDDRDRLITEHIDMARRIAQRIGRRVPDWIRHEDLIAAALLGLADAADRFDAARGGPFVAFAEPRIRGAVLDELRRGDIMPRRVRATARRVGEAMREVERKIGREPEDEEVARELGVSVEVYRGELEQLTHVRLIELPALDEGEAPTPSPDDEAARAELRAGLERALATLPERDRLLLALYYLEELSYSEIGHVLGVSESRICQLHGRAVARLRTALAPFAVEPEELLVEGWAA